MILARALQFVRRHGPGHTLYYARCRVRNAYWRWRLRSQGVRVGRDVWFDGPVDITIVNGGSITVGDGCNFGKYAHLKVNGGQIVLKEHVKVNRFCIVQAHRLVVFEPHVLTAPYVHVMDANHNIETDLATQEADAAWGLPAAPVLVGAHAWLGSGVKVLAGVTIGDHAVIGAGAVVTRDVPAGAVAAGVPARVLRYRAGLLSSTPNGH